MKSLGIPLVAFFISVLALLSPSVAAQAEEIQQEVTPDLGELVSYSHAGGLFTLQIPSGWEQKNLGDEQVSRAFFYQPNGPSWMVVAIFNRDEVPLSEHELGFQLQKDLKNVFRDYSNFIMDLEPTVQNDGSVRVVFEYDFEYDEDTVVMQGNSFIQQDGGYLSFIYVMVPEDEFPELKPGIDRILNSYQVNSNVLW